MAKSKSKKNIISDIKDNYKKLEASLVSQLHLEVSNHQLTKGHYREQIWMDFFRQIIPYKFALRQSVFLIDAEGEVSREVDIAVFDEQYTPYIFNYGNIHFIPIEAVAVAIQCKSESININRDDLIKWSRSISRLKTSTKSIARMYTGVIHGDIENNGNKDSNQFSQTATRPIRILCYLQGKEKSISIDSELFDIYLNARKIENEHKLVINFCGDDDLSLWYEKLNHSDKVLRKKYAKNYERGKDLALSRFEVNGNSILSLIFQLNQLLMLINNPMLFPHQAYVDCFNKKK